MAKEYKISQLIMNNEVQYYDDNPKLKQYRKVKEIYEGRRTKYLTWVDDKHMKSIATPEGRELTSEELFDFVIGNNITDFSRSRNISENSADIAIVLGSADLPTTRERAIKAFELYKLGRVKKIIFTGGIPETRDKKCYMHPKSLDDYMDNKEIDLEWSDLPEGDWGAETFIPNVFDEDYKKHSSKLTEEFFKSIGVNAEDVLSEPLSTDTMENAAFCKNAIDSLEIDTGMKVRSAIIVTTCTHGNRAMRMFKKIFGDRISLKWCPSTLDLERHERLKAILNAQIFDENAFRQELKRIYCTVPELMQKLKEETANHRNAFILGYIDEPTIKINDREKEDYDDVEL